MLQAAQAAAGAQVYPPATLYVVATPIGNLADLSLRALHTLQLVDAVACEDTRHTSALMRHFGLDKPLIKAHEHNEREAAEAILQRLKLGERVAYVSDAGTPAVSDPGARLVDAVSQAGFRCLPIPGASSAVTAMSVAGDVHGEGFRFVGFLPAKPRERESALKEKLADGSTLVLFEAPHRIDGLVDALSVHAAGRQVSLCRELTKQFEQVHTAMAETLPAWLAQDAHRAKGEFVVVVHASAPKDVAQELPPEVSRTLDLLCAELPLKQAVSLCASITGHGRNELYAQALARRQASEQDET